MALLGPDEGRVLIRSALPYTLDLILHARRRGAGVLETSLDGDLVGSVRWVIDEERDGTRLRLEQDVEVTGRWLRVLPDWARGPMVWNHDRMMAGGIAGLRRELGAG